MQLQVANRKDMRIEGWCAIRHNQHIEHTRNFEAFNCSQVNQYRRGQATIEVYTDISSVPRHNLVAACSSSWNLVVASAGCTKSLREGPEEIEDRLIQIALQIRQDSPRRSQPPERKVYTSLKLLPFCLRECCKFQYSIQPAYYL